MDIEKLIEQLKNLEACAYGYHINGEVLGMDCSDFEQIMIDAADEISKIPTLQIENEKLREKIEDARLEGYVKGLGEMSAELEQVIAERGALIEDFVDYVTDGVPNPAIFCKNRCNKCVDMRGWCTGKNCKGFYPSVASGQKED